MFFSDKSCHNEIYKNLLQNRTDEAKWLIVSHVVYKQVEDKTLTGDSGYQGRVLEHTTFKLWIGQQVRECIPGWEKLKVQKYKYAHIKNCTSGWISGKKMVLEWRTELLCLLIKTL